MIRLAVRVRRQQAELVLAELLELAPSGVEEVDVSPEVIEYAVFGAPGELPELPELTAAVGGALVEVVATEIADDWSERWREFHRPVVLGHRLTVRPPWEPVGQTPIDLVIDPGQAFGTGAHATTRLCLELMLGLDGGGSFLDLGCGSGVLAIAASKLGWDPVAAVDHDSLSIEATRENAAANAARIVVERHDVRVDPVPVAATIAANLLTPLLLAWSRRLAQAPERPAQLILSGLLATEADRIAESFGLSGYSERERHGRGEWAALLLAKG